MRGPPLKFEFLDPETPMPLDCRTLELEIESEEYQVKDVAKAILHTILFHRCLVQTMPMEVDLRFVDVTYIKCDNADIEMEIDHAASQLQSLFDNAAAGEKPAGPQQAELIFFERRDRKSWFFKTPHEQVWERWRLKIKLISRQTDAMDVDQTRMHVERQLQSALIYVASMSLEGADMIPPLKASPKPFPFKIQVAGAGSETLVGILRRMVTDSSAAPPILG